MLKTKKMEPKSSTVKRVSQNTKSYTGNYGKMYVHYIEFDNGDSGEYQSKKETCDKFIVGQVAQYTREERINGNYTNIIIKPVQEISQGGFLGARKGSGSLESFALAYAKDLACANIAKDKNISAKQVTEVAEEFYNWLKSKSN